MTRGVMDRRRSKTRTPRGSGRPALIYHLRAATMPFRVATDEDRRQIHAATTADLTAEDIAAVLNLRSGDRRSYSLLFDFSTGTRPANTGDELRGIAGRLSTLVQQDGPRGPTAIVTHDEASFGMARMYETFCELAGIPNVRVFRTIVDAQHWIEQHQA